MVQISEIIITENKGFFADKGFEWKNIGNFSIITGVNGSGKTKLLEYIYNSDGNHSIRYIDVTYKPPSEKHANEIANKYTFRMQDIDGKQIVTNRINNKTQDWTGNKQAFRQNRVFEEIDYPIIESIIQLNKNFRNNDESYDAERERIKNYKLTFNINNLLPANKNDDQPWDRIDRILKEFGLFIRVDRVNLNAELGFLRFNPSTSKELGLEMKDLSSGEKVAFALALWTWGNSTGQKTEVLLIDEFDAHLNPSIAEKFIVVIKKYFVDFGVQVIMTTHNPSTVAFGKELSADIVWMSDGQIDKDMEYRDIIHVLSSGMLDINQLAEDAQILVKSDKSIVLFTEGRIDAEYIKTAIRVLGKKLEFGDIEIFACTGAPTIPAFVRIPFGKKKSIALLDNDPKGKDVAKTINNDEKLKSKIAEKKLHVLYVSPEDNKTIEDLFSDSLKAKGKSGVRKFLRNKDNQTQENFANFMPLLDNIISAANE